MIKNEFYKVVAILCLLLITGSVFYYFVIRPIANDEPYRACMALAESVRKVQQETYEKEGSTESTKRTTDLNPIKIGAMYQKITEECFNKYKK